MSLLPVHRNCMYGILTAFHQISSNCLHLAKPVVKACYSNELTESSRERVRERGGGRERERIKKRWAHGGGWPDLAVIKNSHLIPKFILLCLSLFLPLPLPLPLPPPPPLTHCTRLTILRFRFLRRYQTCRRRLLTSPRRRWPDSWRGWSMSSIQEWNHSEYKN